MDIFAVIKSRNTTHWCKKCSKDHNIKLFSAAHVILKKHNIVLDTKSHSFDVDVLDKIKELKQFYDLLGSSKEKPDSKLIDFNPYSDMFKD